MLKILVRNGCTPCLGQISGTIRWRKFELGRGSSSATSLCDLDVTFDHKPVTLDVKNLVRKWLHTLSGPNLMNYKVDEITWGGYSFWPSFSKSQRRKYVTYCRWEINSMLHSNIVCFTKSLIVDLTTLTLNVKILSGNRCQVEFRAWVVINKKTTCVEILDLFIVPDNDTD